MSRHSLARVALRSAAIGYVLCLILLPLVSISAHSMEDGFARFLEDVRQPAAASALILTVQAALVTTLINAAFGTLSAWVLVRYDFAGRAFLNALVDLPFAIPTLVAGLMIAALYGTTSPIGARLQQGGIEVLYNLPGIILAMLFVTMPFTIRAFQPVLMELEKDQEEAAYTLGSKPMESILAGHESPPCCRVF